MADVDKPRAVVSRVDLIDLPALRAVAFTCNWLRILGVTGSGFSRLISLEPHRVKPLVRPGIRSRR